MKMIQLECVNCAVEFDGCPACSDSEQSHLFKGIKITSNGVVTYAADPFDVIVSTHGVTISYLEHDRRVKMRIPTVATQYATTQDLLNFLKGCKCPAVGGPVGPAYVHPNHTGDVTSTGDGATVISDDAVKTSKVADNAITNAKVADMPPNTIKGNNTGAAGDPKDLTVAEAKAMLGVSAFISLPGDPAPATGVDGDHYINQTTGEIFEKVAGAWVSVYKPLPNKPILPYIDEAAAIADGVLVNEMWAAGPGNAFATIGTVMIRLV